MGDDLSKERRITLTSCLGGEKEEEEEEYVTCECGYPNGHPPRNPLNLRDLTASSLDSRRLERVNAMDLDPPFLVQKRIMVEILLSAYNNLCNRVNVPFSEEPLFEKLELLITTQRMELLSLETSTLRPLTPKPAETQDSIISTNPGGMALPGHILPMEVRAQIHWGEFHPFLILMLDGFNKSTDRPNKTTPKHYFLVCLISL